MMSGANLDFTRYNPTRLGRQREGRFERVLTPPLEKGVFEMMSCNRSLKLLVALPSVVAAVVLLATGCASWRAVNVPLDRVDPQSGYHPERITRSRHTGDVMMAVSFSGGGTRAAALAYGVLQELRDTQVSVGGERERLLDEVDTITSVSGGSFTSAYYGLYGDRIFEDFEERFLKRNVQRSLLWRMLWPQNFVRLIFPFFDRTELAIDYYDKKIFDGARFEDLTEAGGPLIQINATDISGGSRFTFIQPQFDLICSDLSGLEVARAVTASSAVPVAFPTIVLKNYAGRCGYQKPPWLEEALASRKHSPRRYHIASGMNAYLDHEKRPYVHLVDGGIADNLGVRGPLDNVILGGGIWQRMQELGADRPHHLVFIVVDASTYRDRSFVSLPRPPSLASLLGSVSDTQLHRYNFETRELLRQNVTRWAAELSSHGEPVQTHLIDVAEYEIDDPDEREFFDSVPTTLGLDEETVDRLVEIGRHLLRESEVFQNLLVELQGESEAEGGANAP
jgi:NTE family protein